MEKNANMGTKFDLSGIAPADEEYTQVREGAGFVFSPLLSRQNIEEFLSELGVKAADVVLVMRYRRCCDEPYRDDYNFVRDTLLDMGLLDVRVVMNSDEYPGNDWQVPRPGSVCLVLDADPFNGYGFHGFSWEYFRFLLEDSSVRLVFFAQGFMDPKTYPEYQKFDLRYMDDGAIRRHSESLPMNSGDCSAVFAALKPLVNLDYSRVRSIRRACRCDARYETPGAIRLDSGAFAYNRLASYPDDNLPASPKFDFHFGALLDSVQESVLQEIRANNMRHGVLPCLRDEEILRWASMASEDVRARHTHEIQEAVSAFQRLMRIYFDGVEVFSPAMGYGARFVQRNRDNPCLWEMFPFVNAILPTLDFFNNCMPLANVISRDFVGEGKELLMTRVRSAKSLAELRGILCEACDQHSGGPMETLLREQLANLG